MIREKGLNSAPGIDLWLPSLWFSFKQFSGVLSELVN